jgi:hypothetical protein
MVHCLIYILVAPRAPRLENTEDTEESLVANVRGLY